MTKVRNRRVQTASQIQDTISAEPISDDTAQTSTTPPQEGGGAFAEQPTTEQSPEQLDADTPPAADEPPVREPKGKLGTLTTLLRRPEGADLQAMMAATGWQAHSVRGAMAGALKRKFGLTIASEKTDGLRIYRIPVEGAR